MEDRGRSDTTCDNHGDKCASSLSSARPQQGSDRPQHSDTNGHSASFWAKVAESFDTPTQFKGTLCYAWMDDKCPHDAEACPDAHGRTDYIIAHQLQYIQMMPPDWKSASYARLLEDPDSEAMQRVRELAYRYGRRRD